MGSHLQEFCLQWNGHHDTLSSVLDSLREQGKLVDVTLAAEGQFIKVHQIVLFACSQYFKELLLSQLPNKQAVFFLKDVQFTDLKALVDYMYKGKVNVSQERLKIFLQTAAALKIKGLLNKEQHQKLTEKISEYEVSPSKPKARLNAGLKEVQKAYPSVNKEKEMKREVQVVLVSEPDDSDEDLVSVYPKRNQQKTDSEFGDDHFEVIENWASEVAVACNRYFENVDSDAQAATLQITREVHVSPIELRYASIFPTVQSENMLNVNNPAVPFRSLINCKLAVGNEIQVHGRVDPFPDRFHVNLQQDPETYPNPLVAFHFNPRIENGDRVIAMNSWFGTWGSEQKIKTCESLLPGKSFVLS